MIAYRMAYLKAHYPYLFMKNLLTMNIGSETKIKEYIFLKEETKSSIRLNC